MPYEDTPIDDLVINVLTKDQYDNLNQHSNSELYFITSSLSGLPEVNSTDNNKILMVVNGKWAAVKIET